MPVYVEASNAIWTGSARPPMVVDFGPGQRFSLRPGRNEIALPPGHYRARFHSQYVFWRVGRAEAAVDIRPGQAVQLHYAAPLTIYSRGLAGVGPLPNRPGGRALAVIIGLAVAFPLVLIGVALTIRTLAT